MRKLLQDKFIFFFLPVIAFVLYANGIESFILGIIFKPLIVITLLIYLFANEGQKGQAAIFAVGGLIFSLFGDVLLIFQGQHALFFMSGLIAFLIAHLFYIVYYIRSAKNTIDKKLKGKFILFLLMLIYGATFYILLYNKLGELKLPVLIYTSVLIGMNIFALNRYGKVNDKSFRLIMTGALLFTLSDSLLALNKFHTPIPFAGVWILATYAAAQYFITAGVIHTSPQPSPQERRQSSHTNLL